jgi:phage regulator Rha-like protein
MEELVFKSEKGNPVTTSLLVARTFGKRHADVLRAIDNLDCSRDFFERNFAFVENQGIGAVKERIC